MFAIIVFIDNVLHWCFAAVSAMMNYLKNYRTTSSLNKDGRRSSGPEAGWSFRLEMHSRASDDGGGSKFTAQSPRRSNVTVEGDHLNCSPKYSAHRSSRSSLFMIIIPCFSLIISLTGGFRGPVSRSSWNSLRTFHALFAASIPSDFLFHHVSQSARTLTFTCLQMAGEAAL